jgi:RNA-binding protein
VELSEKQKKHLRRLAHSLSPVVMIGSAGLTAPVVSELDRALAAHELVKVSVRVADRARRNAALAALGAGTASELVQRVGHVGVFYRRRHGLAVVMIPDE